jgi:alpha-beta hydrolase superfamily lysophospholipase
MQSIGEVTGTDGTRLRARVWDDARRVPHANLVWWSGVVSHAGWFVDVAAPLVERGYRVIGADRRGSGLNQSREDDAATQGGAAEPRADAAQTARGDVASAGVVVDDAVVQARALSDARAPIVLVGWCWGSILAVHALGKLPEVRGLVLLTPGLWPTAEVAAGMAALVERARDLPPEDPVLPSPITDEMFTSGRALEAFVRRDPLKWSAFSPRFLAASSKLTAGALARLRTVQVPTLAVLARDDRATDNVAARAGLQAVPHCRVVELPGAHAHGLAFDAGPALVDTLDAWIRDALAVP